MQNYKCFQVNLKSLEASKTIPELSSLRANTVDVRNKLQVINSKIVHKEYDEALYEQCEFLLDNNLMYWAEASKSELITVMAKLLQFKGLDFIKTYKLLANRYYRNIKLTEEQVELIKKLLS